VASILRGKDGSVQCVHKRLAILETIIESCMPCFILRLHGFTSFPRAKCTCKLKDNKMCRICSFSQIKISTLDCFYWFMMKNGLVQYTFLMRSSLSCRKDWLSQILKRFDSFHYPRASGTMMHSSYRFIILFPWVWHLNKSIAPSHSPSIHYFQTHRYIEEPTSMLLWHWESKRRPSVISSIQQWKQVHLCFSLFSCPGLIVVAV
jgi:hypothetical protein